MVSGRKFFSITIMMVVLLFMFQFTLVIREKLNEYDENNHITDTKLTSEDAWKMEKSVDEDGEFVVFIGNMKKSIGQNAEEWCTYTKRNLLSYDSITEYIDQQSLMPEVILLDADAIHYETDIDILFNLAEKGISIIFCSLPDASVIQQDEQLQKLLGIESVWTESVDLTGVKLFSGFLLGGEAIYQAETKEEQKRQDLELQIPWYYLSSGTKTYMVGMLEDETVKNEELPGIIWRNSIGSSRIFAVNGSYISDVMGIGILEAMMSQIHSYELYPVVNAQNLVVLNYPGLTPENEEQMEQLYSRNQTGVFRDIVWPGLVSTSKKNKFRLTFMITPQVNYMDLEEPSGEELITYLKQLKEEDAEAGLSMEYTQNMSLQVKVNRDGAFYQSTGTEYQFHAVAAAASDVNELMQMRNKYIMSNMKTVTCEYSNAHPVLSYCAKDVTLQSSTSTGVSHTYTDDLRLRSLETVLGYTNIHLNMNRVAWPETEEDRWENFSEKFSSNLDTYWKPFKKFEKTTLSESDTRVRNFLVLDYEEERSENIIHLRVSGNEQEVWFILRLHGEKIDKIQGGNYEELESDVYLICAEQDNVEIQLKEDNDLYYYLP
ncbi:MAG: DUF2194 domain-containing protein [Lachnospiraceae bacterium]|nr:DUF2194 domain-containing protein [Lachnospiraceae bacterium]